nr:MAG TPA: hypothetical protein [Caudoviricetes sp.]
MGRNIGFSLLISGIYVETLEESMTNAGLTNPEERA